MLPIHTVNLKIFLNAHCLNMGYMSMIGIFLVGKNKVSSLHEIQARRGSGRGLSDHMIVIYRLPFYCRCCRLE